MWQGDTAYREINGWQQEGSSEGYVKDVGKNSPEVHEARRRALSASSGCRLDIALGKNSTDAGAIAEALYVCGFDDWLRTGHV